MKFLFTKEELADVFRSLNAPGCLVREVLALEQSAFEQYQQLINKYVSGEWTDGWHSHIESIMIEAGVSEELAYALAWLRHEVKDFLKARQEE